MTDGTVRTSSDRGLVAILAGRSPAERYSLHAGYVDSVVAVGGTPLIVPTGPGIDGAKLRQQVRSCDALLVSGGVDVHPSLSHPTDPNDAIDCDLERDLLEIDAIRTALEEGIRVLGICRGIQILAVAFGGRLIGDLGKAGFSGHDEAERQYELVHGIEPVSGSIAERILGGATSVNSAHHQAVGEPGAGLAVTAKSADGVIEAIEADNVVGVQWHPERLSGLLPLHLEPFRWLVS